MPVLTDDASLLDPLDECVPGAVVRDGQTEGVLRLFQLKLLLLP